MRRYLLVFLIIVLLSGCTTPGTDLPGGRSAPSDPTLEGAPTYTPAPTAMWTPAVVEAMPTPTWQPESAGGFTFVAPIGYEWLGNLNSLMFDTDGTLWLVNDLNVLSYRDGVWTPYLVDITDMLLGMDSQRRVWTTPYDGSLISAWDGTAWTVFGEAEGWTFIDAYQYTPVDPGILEDATGNIWVATAQDVRVLKDGRWEVITPTVMKLNVGNVEDSYPSFTIGLVDGEVWVGECDWSGPGPMGGSGIVRQTALGWQAVKIGNAGKGCVTKINQDTAGNTFIGIGNTLYWRLAGSSAWQSYKPDVVQSTGGEVRPGYVLNAAVDPAGQVWATFSMCGGASCDTAESTYIIGGGGDELAYPPRDPFYQDLVFASNGDAWLMGNFTNPELVYGRTTTPVRELLTAAVAQDADGQIWVIGQSRTQVGLWKLDGN